MVNPLNHTNLNTKPFSSISNILADFGLFGWKTHFKSMLIFYWKLLTLPLIAASLDRVTLATTHLLHKCFMGWLFVPLLTSTLSNSLGVEFFFFFGCCCCCCCCCWRRRRPVGNMEKKEWDLYSWFGKGVC